MYIHSTYTHIPRTYTQKFIQHTHPYISTNTYMQVEASYLQTEQVSQLCFINISLIDNSMSPNLLREQPG